MRILLIDDDKDDQEIFRDAVSEISGDISCFTADNGQVGLEFLRTCIELPDVIFLDINMPLMDGMETHKHIRTNPNLKNIKVVMYSTSSAHYEIAWFNKMETPYITKPSNFRQLVDLLKEHLTDIIITERNQAV